MPLILTNFFQNPRTVELDTPVIRSDISVCGGAVACANQACLRLDSGGRICNCKAHSRTIYETLQNLALSEWHIGRSILDGGAMERTQRLQV
jgi:hypothetical protein